MDPEDLYGLPLERFTAERNALAKSLRKAGDRAQATRVAKLSKPSLAAWAVNQLVRTQKRDVAALFKAGDQLVAAQGDLLAGRGAAAPLRDAAEAERVAADKLVARARGLLGERGTELGPQRLEQVRETLHAAALDPEARAEVSAGCLVKELQHVGLGSLTTVAATPTPARRQAPKVDAAKLRAARQAAEEAERRMDRAQRAVEVAQAKRDRARSQLKASEEKLAAALSARESAVREHERAQRAFISRSQASAA